MASSIDGRRRPVSTRSDGKAWEIPDDFSFAHFFGTMSDGLRIQMSRDEMEWIETYSAPDRRPEVLLNLSCGAQLSPHLMRAVVVICRALDIDFEAVGGRQFCCGKIYSTCGRPESGDRMTAASVRRFASFEPQVTVQICGSCQQWFHWAVDEEAGERGAEPAFANQHITGFLAERMAQMGDRIPWRREVRTRVLVHGHEGWQTEQREHAVQVMSMIPGVEVVGLAAPPTLGMPCAAKGPGADCILGDISTAEYRQVQRELEEQAEAVGADTLSCVYHACSREWGKFASERLAFRQYFLILAEALGYDIPDRYQRYWALGDPDAIVDAAVPAWTSWGLDREQARDIAERHFVARYEKALPQCACGGDPSRCEGAPDGTARGVCHAFRRPRT